MLEGPGNNKYKSLLYIDSNEILFTCVNAIKQLYSKILDITIKVSLIEKQLKDKDRKIDLLQKQVLLLSNRISELEKQSQ